MVATEIEQFVNGVVPEAKIPHGNKKLSTQEADMHEDTIEGSIASVTKEEEGKDALEEVKHWKQRTEQKEKRIKLLKNELISARNQISRMQAMAIGAKTVDDAIAKAGPKSPEDIIAHLKKQLLEYEAKLQ